MLEDNSFVNIDSIFMNVKKEARDHLYFVNSEDDSQCFVGFSKTCQMNDVINTGIGKTPKNDRSFFDTPSKLFGQPAGKEAWINYYIGSMLPISVSSVLKKRLVSMVELMGNRQHPFEMSNSSDTGVMEAK